MRPIKEMFPDILMCELLRLARLDRDWVRWEPLEGNTYKASVSTPTFLRKLWTAGSDAFGMWALSIWLVDGPKVFTPTIEQCDDMERIEVNIELGDYEQPYPALMIDLPPGRYAPFENIICHRSPNLLACVLNSADHRDDITTTVAIDNRPIEVSLQRYDEDCAEMGVIAGKALRVAINSCLCLVNFGCRKEHLLKKQFDNDRKLANEQSERGQRAKERLRTAVSVVTFAQQVTLRDNPHRGNGGGEPTGREMPPHWRRGHWAMVACGKGRAERRRVLRKPCLVRADMFVGNASDTSTTYHRG